MYDLQSTQRPADYAAAVDQLLARQRRRALVVLVTNLRDEDDETLLTYSDNASVFDRHGRLGSLEMEHVEEGLRWVYYDLQVAARIVLGPDLPSAAVEVSKRYLDGRLSAPLDEPPPLPA